MPSCDTIVIGGGPNGLACAARLARAGQDVMILESGPAPGGGMAPVHSQGAAEIAPGYATPALAHLHQIDDRVMRGMRLAAHGFASQHIDTLALRPGAAPLRITAGAAPGPDAAAWAALHAQLARFAGALAPFRGMIPPRPAKGAGNDNLALARIGMGLRGLGRADFREFMRMLLINIADVLDDALTDDALKGAVAFDATLGAWMGPRSPNSLILYLNRLAAGAPQIAPGGVAAMGSAMVRAAQAAGVTVRCDARVARVVVRDDRAIGVDLADGTFVDARNIVSTLHPRTTFETLIGPAHLDTGFLRQSRAIKSRGAAAKLHLALKSAPDFGGADLAQRLVIAPSVNAVEDAWNAVKYGEVPDRPVMEIVFPSAHGTGHAPEGGHVLSAIVQCAPHDPRDRTAAKFAMLANAMAVLEAHAPGIGDLVIGSDLLMPWDIEAHTGMIGGNWHHGELAVERMLFLRPMAGAAQYATPLDGVWIGGAGAHPGGGITGAAGWNAATQLLIQVRG